MSSQSLTNRFFKEHPLEENSAAMITYFIITSNKEDALWELLSEVGEKNLFSKHNEEILLERKIIEQMDDPTELVEKIRKGFLGPNQLLLCKKTLEYHEKALPVLLRRYRTSALDQFIETATMILSLGEKKYAAILREMYQDIRNPYAQACACLVFGMQGMKDEGPFLLEEYERFCREEPDESFEQYPLLALYILHGKI